MWYFELQPIADLSLFLARKGKIRIEFTVGPFYAVLILSANSTPFSFFFSK